MLPETGVTHPPQHPSGGSPFIFVVEDDPDTRDLYAQYFALQGLRVETASDGPSALRMIVTLVPDVIVMDLSLPRLHGWEVTRRLKADPRTSRIPVVVCTGYLTGGSTEQELEAGCDAYVLKPCTPDALLKEIQQVLARVAGGRPSGPSAVR
jgi:two-component system cell cycle response regulator DivK